MPARASERATVQYSTVFCIAVGTIRPHALTRAGLERRAVRQRWSARRDVLSAHKQNENRPSSHNGLNRSRRPRASWTSGRRSRRRTRHVAPSAPTPRTLPRWRPPRLGQARPRRAAAAPWLGLGFGFGLGFGSGIGFGLGRALGLGLGMGLGWTSSSSTAGACLVSLLSRCTAAALDCTGKGHGPCGEPIRRGRPPFRRRCLGARVAFERWHAPALRLARRAR